MEISFVWSLLVRVLLAARLALSIDQLDILAPVTVPHLADLSVDEPIREFKSYQPPCPKEVFKKYGQCNETDFIKRLKYCDELNAILLKREVKYRDPQSLNDGPQPCLGLGDDNLFDTTQILEMIEIYEESEEDPQTGGSRGDIFVSRDGAEETDTTSRRVKRSSKLIRDFKINRWDMPIKYKIDGYLAAYGEKTIKRAIHEWEKNTCIRFEEIDVDDLPHEQHLVFLPTASRVCYSYIGKTRTGEEDMSQPIFLSYLCMTKGILEHEIGHSLGLIHEHQRPDRDKYVNIIEDNVRSTAKGLFSTIPNKFIDTRKVPYDYASNMHYTGSAFSANGSNTIETKDKRFQRTIGQRVELTFWDILTANMAYCDHICNDIKLDRPCANSGYQDPNNCSRCLCPDGWSGVFCDEVAPSVGDFCGGHIWAYGSEKSYLQSPNYKSQGAFNYYATGQECTWLITAQKGKRLVLSFEDDVFSVFCYEECLHWVEIRYGDDLGANGPRFCCYEKPDDVILSTTNQALILFRARDDFPAPHERQGFKLAFRADGDECSSQPCYNGGLCTDGIAEYICNCPWPYTGRRCESRVPNFCANRPCQNGGSCISGQSGYYCHCRSPYYGENCELSPELVIQQWKSVGTVPSTSASSTTNSGTTTAVSTTTTATRTTPTTTTAPTTTIKATTTTTKTTTTPTTTTIAATKTTMPTTSTTVAPTSTSRTAPRQPPTAAREEDQMDIMLLLDVSALPGKDLARYKAFLKKLIKMFHYGQSATRIGLITVSRLARTASSLKAHDRLDDLFDVLDRQHLDLASSTCDYYNAIWLLLTDSYTDTNGGRRNVPDLAFMLVDNRPSEKHLDIYKGIKLKAMQRLRDKNIEIYAIGVGESVDQNELLQITGTESYYFHASNYQELLREHTVLRTHDFIKYLANEARQRMNSVGGSQIPTTSATTTSSTVIGQPSQTSDPSRPTTVQNHSLLTRILTSKAPLLTPKPTTAASKTPRCWWEQVGPCSEPCGGCGRKKMVFFCTSTSEGRRIYGQLWESCNNQACPKYCSNGRGSDNWVCGTMCCNSTYKQVDGVCVKRKQ